MSVAAATSSRATRYIVTIVIDVVQGVIRIVVYIIVIYVHSTCFQFGEDFREESGLSVYSQHIRAEAVDNEQTSELCRN